MGRFRTLIYFLVGLLVRVGRRLEPPPPPKIPVASDSGISAEIKQFYKKELLKNHDMTPLFQDIIKVDAELAGYNNFGPKVEWRRWQPEVPEPPDPLNDPGLRYGLVSGARGGGKTNMLVQQQTVEIMRVAGYNEEEIAEALETLQAVQRGEGDDD